MAITSLKRLINSGKMVNGVGVDMGYSLSDMERTIADSSCDFLSIDSQHAPYNEDRLEEFCRNAKSLDMPVLFRIKHTRHTYLIGNYLDLGPTGIVVPEVRDVSTVDEALHSFYYPQKGKRSWGGSSRWGIEAHPDRLDYASWWNETGVLQLQLESVDAVINCRKLGKCGVDAFTFGPNDLSYDIESYSKPPFRSVDECVAHVVKELDGTGIAVGIALHDPKDRQRYVDMGLTVLQTPPIT